LGRRPTSKYRCSSPLTLGGFSCPSWTVSSLSLSLRSLQFHPGVEPSRMVGFPSGTAFSVWRFQVPAQFAPAPALRRNAPRSPIFFSFFPGAPPSLRVKRVARPPVAFCPERRESLFSTPSNPRFFPSSPYRSSFPPPEHRPPWPKATATERSGRFPSLRLIPSRPFLSLWTACAPVPKRIMRPFGKRMSALA